MPDGPLIVQSDKTLLLEIDHAQAVDCRKAIAPFAELERMQALQARGHRVEVINDSYQDFGAGQFIWRMGDPKVEGYVVASDARRDGLVAGF